MQQFRQWLGRPVIAQANATLPFQEWESAVLLTRRVVDGNAHYAVFFVVDRTPGVSAVRVYERAGMTAGEAMTRFGEWVTDGCTILDTFEKGAPWQGDLWR